MLRSEWDTHIEDNLVVCLDDINGMMNRHIDVLVVFMENMVQFREI